jgi:hypothetical protein
MKPQPEWAGLTMGESDETTGTLLEAFGAGTESGASTLVFTAINAHCHHLQYLPSVSVILAEC